MIFVVVGIELVVVSVCFVGFCVKVEKGENDWGEVEVEFFGVCGCSFGGVLELFVCDLVIYRGSCSERMFGCRCVVLRDVVLLGFFFGCSEGFFCRRMFVC